MGDDDFTFAVVLPPHLAAGGGVLPRGRMSPLYPVFGRPRSPPRPPEPETATVRVPLGRLLLVDREPSPAQPPANDLASVPAEVYCPWSPGWSAAAAVSPVRCRKSGSTGSVLRWRPRLVGRSQSDGKEKFVFLNTSASGSERQGRTGDGAGGGHAWSYYAKGGGGGNGARRRSFLPYKQDLIGLFANAAVFRRSYHPF
ncbi:uncharacterized protein LOC133929916 [Phragmites australis]|uniref:uncharacterized protein LOC133929916 n=1 Tax=Phragmites australis TaxID=29695 RepID=UPI002D79E238|nr:uncharacterized protein LOC133929916 [Phragmites australis]